MFVARFHCNGHDPPECASGVGNMRPVALKAAPWVYGQSEMSCRGPLGAPTPSDAYPEHAANHLPKSKRHAKQNLLPIVSQDPYKSFRHKLNPCMRRGSMRISRGQKRDEFLSLPTSWRKIGAAGMQPRKHRD